MNGRIVRRITLWLIVGVVISGCASPVPVTPPPSVSRSEGIETIVVKTAAAAQTQTAVLLPTATGTPTKTPLPTKTGTVTPTPTATIIFSFLTETGPTEEFFGNVEGSGNGSGDGNKEDGKGSDFVKEPVIREWACRILSRYPPAGTEFVGGTTFRATWVVKNTGSKTWPKKGVDVVYQSGADLVDGKPYVDIPAAVGPGGTIQITINMTAPKRSSDYSTRWTLKVGKKEFCSMRIAFNTK
jgi:hypothetical protein